MIAFVARRLLQVLPVLFLTSIVVFLFIRLIPGDPALAIAGRDAKPEQVQAIRQQFGLDRPIPIQYLAWITRVAQGDLGTAYLTRRPIGSLILQRLPPTLHLAAGATLVMLALGVPLGIFSATRPRHPLSRLISLVNAVALATPTFWLGILLLLVFAVALPVVPPSGYVSITENPVQSIKLLILPSLTLGASGTAILIRFLKASVGEVAGADFIRTAYAKGLRERAVVGRHVLKIALPPVVTVMAIQLGYLLGGAVITEAIFGWPGVGRLMLDAVANRDYLIVQSTMLLFVATFMLVNILADVAYALLDPRIRQAMWATER